MTEKKQKIAGWKSWNLLFSIGFLLSLQYHVLMRRDNLLMDLSTVSVF